MGAAELAKAREIITGYKGRTLRLMEVCGTHTHEIFRLGVRRLLPENVELISGPGCPVCVTPVAFIDEAIWLANERGVTVTTFGDLVRVPGTQENLGQARSRGAKVEVVYTPLDAVDYAAAHPDEEVVFLAVGFETTTPASALAIQKAEKLGLKNFAILTALKTMNAAYEALAGSVDAYIYPGHVCAIAGTEREEKLAERGISGVVAGFTAAELVTALAVAVAHLAKEEKGFFVNCYPRVVKREGSRAAMALVAKYFNECDTEWRGLGVIPGSGLELKDAYADFDARRRFAIPPQVGRPNPACHCGEVLQGKCKPPQCPVFGKVCTPEHPVGACMVSSEGACAAYYQYGGDL